MTEENESTNRQLTYFTRLRTRAPPSRVAAPFRGATVRERVLWLTIGKSELIRPQHVFRLFRWLPRPRHS